MNAYIKEVSRLLDKKKKKIETHDQASEVKYVGLKKTNPSMIHYSRRHRGEWFKPEYNFKQLQIAQHTDSILLRTIKKKADRFLIAGYELVGNSQDPVEYVSKRLAQMEYVSSKPWLFTLRETVEDLTRQGNCMWAKVRSLDSSSGEVRTDLSGKELEPVASYYILPFETLEFKTKVNGEIKKVRQVGDDGEIREWSPQDIIHFYTDRKAGFTVGTPELLPAMDDIALLRRLEENVEELVETHLFPVYHYKIGTDAMPERVTEGGTTEAEVIKAKIEYMPAGSIYVSDHRHEITAIGAEGKALTIDNYLGYFKQRAISAAGGTEVDLGMSGQANRSTANTLSQSMTLDIEALQIVMKTFIDFFVIKEILLEGGYDPFDSDNKVEIKFGIIDREERIALENQQIQMFTSNVRSLDEVRRTLGDKPVDEEWIENTFYKMFEEPLAMIKSSAQPGSAAGEVLAEIPSSNMTPEAVNKSKTFAKQMQKTQAAGRAAGGGRKPGKAASSSAKRTAAAKSRPSNQSGTRSAPKLNRDNVFILDNKEYSYPVSEDVSEEKLAIWQKLIEDRWEIVKNFGIKPETIIDNILMRVSNEI